MEGIATLSFLNKPTFGFGALAHLNAEVARLGMKRPLICTDPGLVDIGLIESVRGVLSNEYGFELFSDVPPNPTQSAVEQALARYKDGDCDGLICFGGGSSIDLGKAVGVLAVQGGTIDQYGLGGERVIESSAPVVAIPTTSGTGSEVSNGAVVVMHDGRKVVLVGPALIPDSAICDPEVTMGLPSVMTAGAGMDAVTHCIEAVLTPLVNQPAEAVGLDGLRHAIREGHLRRAVADGSDKQARYSMMLASTEGAMAFTKGLGAVHSMSHACGSIREWKLHHGTLNGVILPTILRFNFGKCGDKYARIAEAMGLPAGTDLADYIERLNEDIGLPNNLATMGVQQDKFDYLATHCLGDLCHYTTPVQPDHDGYLKLFAQASGILS